MDEYTPETEPADRRDWSKRAPLIIAVVAATGGLILVCLFAYLILGGGDGFSILGDDDRPTPTAFVPTLPANFRENLLSVQIGGGAAVSVTIDAPTFVQVGGRDFSVQREVVTEGGFWTPSIGSENSAVWINGTVVNYIFAIADTAANRALMQSLQPGDRITLSTKSDQARTFEFDSRSIVAVSNRAVFAQSSPGITLLLVGLGAESTDRMVVQGRYVVDDDIQSAPVGGAGANVVQLGEVAQLGDVQLTATLFDSRAQATGGFSYFLIDYQLINTGVTQLDTSVFQLVLIDQAGNQYALNAQAGLAGNNPQLIGVLAPGASLAATAGYQIPAGLPTSSLVWRVRRVDTGAQVDVLSGVPGSAQSTGDVGVQVSNAQISDDGGSLLVQGQIANLGGSPVIVTESDVVLVANGATYLKLSTSPAFPWIVDVGQTIPFSVAVQRPINADNAVFTVLNQSFELAGLR